MAPQKSWLRKHFEIYSDGYTYFKRANKEVMKDPGSNFVSYSLAALVFMAGAMFVYQSAGKNMITGFTVGNSISSGADEVVMAIFSVLIVALAITSLIAVYKRYKPKK